jgi:hypothetical protein
MLGGFCCGWVIWLPWPAPAVPAPFWAIANMPRDKHATAIAVILLVFPDFILPLKVEIASARPVGF